MGDYTRGFQTLVASGIVLLGLGLGWGALDIPADAGYSGVGPNFLPWVVSVSLTLCGAVLMLEARTTGFADLDEPTGDDKPYWMGFVWMSAGLLINAALITRLGFIVSCALCFVLACRGLRNAQDTGATGQTAGIGTWVRDAVVGLLIAAPVYWMFTRFLAINLPSLTNTGWI